MKRSIAFICLVALVICLTANVKAKAATLPAAYDVLAQQPGVDLTSLYHAYEQLNYEQQTIVHYIIGAYNNMYLTARGFTYNIQYSQSAVMEEFKTLGQRVLDFAFTSNGWRSRVNEVFRQYISGAIVYASQVNTSFMTWYDALLDGTIPELFIPYTDDAFDAWTTFYNDPSGDGIQAFSDVVTDWDSGTFYDFDFVGYVWDSASESRYNNFILNHSPVLFTKKSNSNNQTVYYAREYINTLCILRSNSGYYNSYRFCMDDFTVPAQYGSSDYCVGLTLRTWSDGNIVAVGETFAYSNTIKYSQNPMALTDLIEYAFNKTPFTLSTSDITDSYPFIEHVYLVDDLNTFSNPEELYNVDSLNIVKPSVTREPYIIAPNDRLLFTTRPVGYDDPLGFWDIIRDNSYDPDTGEQAIDDDFRQDIVNNTVINNYYVTDNDKINVPVEWFENDFTDQLANDSIPFLTFARDCIDTLGDIQIYLYGAVVFGLGGGILKKFLL